MWTRTLLENRLVYYVTLRWIPNLKFKYVQPVQQIIRKKEKRDLTEKTNAVYIRLIFLEGLCLIVTLNQTYVHRIAPLYF